MQNFGGEGVEENDCKNEEVCSFYSFKVMHSTLGMSWYSTVLKKRSRGGNRKSKERGEIAGKRR